MNHLKIPAKLQPLLMKKKRFKIVIGGRGSGKSTGVADTMLMKMETENADILCLREFQDSIDDSVHKLFKGRLVALNIADRFDHTDKKIQCSANGKGTRYKGASRNSTAIKSAEGFKYSWFEEAQTISEETLEHLLPTIRVADSELWFSANPASSNDPFSQRFITPYLDALEKNGYYEDDLHIIVVLNWRDNPWFPDELEEQRQWDYKYLPRAKYDHIWEGKFDDMVKDSIILPEWFDACVDAHKVLGFKATGIEVVAHDPSDLGHDAKGLCYRHGVVIKDVDYKEDGDINEGCDWATDYSADKRVDVFTWDCDGMGVGLNRQVDEALTPKGTKLFMYRGSESPRNKDIIFERVGEKSKTNGETFANRRAQGYWFLRERMRKTYLAVEKGEYHDPHTLLSISSDIASLLSLRSELCRIPKKRNGYGKIQIMSKEEMKKLKIKSPNMADSVMMAMFYEVEDDDNKSESEIPHKRMSAE